MRDAKCGTENLSAAVNEPGGPLDPCTTSVLAIAQTQANKCNYKLNIISVMLCSSSDFTAAAAISTDRPGVIVVRYEPEEKETVGEAVEAALIYFPGALIPAENYVSLARDLQAALRSAAVRLHVVIASGHRGIVDLLRAGFTPIRYCRQQFSACIAALRDQASFTPTPQQLFIAGHSMGGMHATVTALNCQLPVEEAVNVSDVDSSLEKSAACAGVVLHGSYATAAYLTAAASPPVATILGDRDGLVRLSHIATRRRQHLQSANANTSTEASRTPLVILPGVSHASFAAGAMTGFVRARDLAATIPPASAAASIAGATAAFLLTVICDTATPQGEAPVPATVAHPQPDHTTSTAPSQGPPQTVAQKHRRVAAQSASAFFLHHLQHDTTLYLDPYTDALQRDLDGITCMDAQREVLSLSGGLDSGSKHCGSGAGAAAAVLPATLMHEQPRRLRAPPRLRRDAFASAAVGDSTGGAKHGTAPSGDAPSVRPCASLTLRRPPGFRISIPAAPTRLRCKLAVPRALRAAGEQRSGAHGATARPAVAAIYSHATAAGQPSIVPEPTAAAASCGGGGSGAATAHSELIPAAHVTQAPVADAPAPHEQRRLSAYTVANMNKRIVERVIRKLPQHIQELYRTAPRPLVFGHDVDVRSASQWLHAELLFHDLSCGPTCNGPASREVPGPAFPHDSSGDTAAAGCATRAARWANTERPCCGSRPDVRGVMLQSPRFVAEAERVLCCTLLSEAQAYEYVLYGSHRVPLSERAQAECLARAAQGTGGSTVVPPAIWQRPCI